MPKSLSFTLKACCTIRVTIKLLRLFANCMQKRATIPRNEGGHVSRHDRQDGCCVPKPSMVRWRFIVNSSLKWKAPLRLCLQSLQTLEDIIGGRHTNKVTWWGIADVGRKQRHLFGSRMPSQRLQYAWKICRQFGGMRFFDRPLIPVAMTEEGWRLDETSVYACLSPAEREQA